MNSLQLAPLPNELIELGNQRWQSYCQHQDYDSALAPFESIVKTAFALSDFVTEQSQQHPAWLVKLLINNALFDEQVDYRALLQEALRPVQNDVQLHQTLRQFRHYHMLRIAWRDLLNMQSIEHSLAQVSELACQLINQANLWLYDALSQRFGYPQGETGHQPLLVIGMGKLGGRELNFSSDIDLIFTYPAQGMTVGGKKSIEHQQFFTKLAQQLIAALNQTTVDGQVYRVDMRLRPFGESGPLVMHFDAMEDYYQEQGRDWERYAMLKARILNEHCHYSDQLAAILNPFIYRRYLDFSALESLRNMKSMIEQEVRRRNLVNNIKLGQGGIREAEFVIQSLQLITGGREPSLQVQSLQSAITQMVELEIMPIRHAKELEQSYLWLRKVEHCLQQFADQQTQVLPTDVIDQKRLLWVLNIERYQDFESLLAQHCQLVHQHFAQLVNETPDEQATKPSTHEHQQTSQDLWQLELEAPEIKAMLEQASLPVSYQGDLDSLCQDLYAQISALKLSLSGTRIGQRGLVTLNRLMPELLEVVLTMAHARPGELLKRVITVLRSILGRTAYLELLAENKGTPFQLVRLCASSSWVTEQIARFPLLLDELLNPSALYQPVAVNQFADDLRQSLLRVEPEDVELHIETLRQFKLSQQLKIAAADISGALPIMQVSDHLTYLAEAIIVQVVEIAWTQMTNKYGAPVCQTHGPKSALDKGFAVFGYGKLGGWELGFGSDLDLVFVHNCDGQLETNGAKSISSSHFYIKLAQRILHIFTIKTGLGELYEVDMRLRPSGNAGLLVCHMNGFITYQNSEAWTWEHQALTRARFIVGTSILKQDFENLRLAILKRTRNPNELRQEVISMREKMRSHLAKGNAENIDLKQDEGGIADIEFIVQFMLLAHTQEHDELARWTDNVRILKDLARLNLISTDAADNLTQAYLEYRHCAHRLALQNETMINANTLLRDHQAKVRSIWEHYLSKTQA